ncbi:DUF885 domain-containing protein [Nakamurella silvestris]|nr:DUF885 domain-containing protein [Nakamurella silvestris]
MTDTNASQARPVSAVDVRANLYVDTVAALDPILATEIGVAGHDHELTDFSPAGHERRAEAAREVLRDIAALPVADETDRITVAAMNERLGVELDLLAARQTQSQMNNLASPVQSIRSSFDLMPVDTVADWEVIAARLAAIPEALKGYLESVDESAASAVVPAARQVNLVADEADRNADPASSFFSTLVAGAKPGGLHVGGALRAELELGAELARSAYAQAAEHLRSRILPKAPAADAVGRDLYELGSRNFLGAVVDQEETYAWGLEELARVVAEQTALAEQIAPGAGIEGAKAVLNSDPARKIHGTAALRDWMQQLSDRAVAELADTHFDIPEPVRRLECRIAPTGNGGIYYSGPSEDFSRPGRMWWDVPHGVEDFYTWEETTTVYHEGVPGHHLQIAQTVFRAQELNRWRRLAAWVSGHGEGWALYAERLMQDLGYLDDLGDRMGMLDGQRLRAGRVVLDIGVHLGLSAPEEIGGGTWDADKAWEFMGIHWGGEEKVRRFEFNRYLGWPGQAPSYKVGQRLWEQIRDESAIRAGASFDLKAFHRQALDVGSVGLDVLKQALLGGEGRK